MTQKQVSQRADGIKRYFLALHTPQFILDNSMIELTSYIQQKVREEYDHESIIDLLEKKYQ